MSFKHLFRCMFTILVIASLTGLAAAAQIQGEASGEVHEYINEGPDFAEAAIYIYHELKDGAKITDTAYGDVTANSTDKCSSIEVAIEDAAIRVSGEVRGDGTAVLYGGVYAGGFRDDINGTYNATAEVASAVDLDSGDKGKATGKVSAEGSAEATIYDIDPDAAKTVTGPGTIVGESSTKLGPMVLEADASGTTSASGTAQSTSGNNGELCAEGTVFSFVEKYPESGIIVAAVYSGVNGEDRSGGTATASGDAYAAMTYGKKGPVESGSIVQIDVKEESGLFTTASGSTKAQGSAKGDGEYEGEADIFSQIHYSHGPIVVYRFTSEVESEGVMVVDNTYRGSASASAMAPFDSSQPGNQWPVSAWSSMGGCRNAETSVQAGLVDAKAYQQGEGMTRATSMVNGQVHYPGFLEGPFTGDEVGLGDGESLEACIGITIHSAPNGYADGSFIGSEAMAEGESSRYSGRAGTSALGAVEAGADGYTHRGLNPPSHSETNTEGSTAAAASAGGTGQAVAEAALQSTNHVLATGIGIVIEADIPLYEDASIIIPDVELPNLPDELCYLLDGVNIPLQSVMLDSMTQFDAGLPDEIPLPDEVGPYTVEILIGTQLPLVETSLIASESSASGLAKKDTASASASADGMTGAQGAIFTLPVIQDSDPDGYPWEAETHAEGEVATSASANRVSDPASVALIFAASVQGADVDNGIDVALIGSASFADGVRGRTSGMADGSASAAGTFTPVMIPIPEVSGPAEADGMVTTDARADGGTGISLAGIVAADFVSYEYPPMDPTPDVEIVDVGAIGSASISLGSATAGAEAEGWARANHAFEYQEGMNDESFTALSANSNVFAAGAASTKTRTSDGIAVAADGLVGIQYLWSESEFANGYAEGQINSGGLIGDVVFAQRPGGRGRADAQADASGVVITSGSFESLIDTGEGPAYISSTAATTTAGGVEGMADVSCGDPLSASILMSYAAPRGTGHDFYLAEGETYAAGLGTSISVASGECARTSGLASGVAIAMSSLSTNRSAIGLEAVELRSSTVVDGDAGTAASTSSPGSLAAAIALNGVSGSTDFIRNVDGFGVGNPEFLWPSFFDLSTTGAVSAVTGNGRASAETGVESAVAYSDFTADDAEETEIVSVGSFTSAEGAAEAEVSARGGYGISAAGEISGIFTRFSSEQFENDPPKGEITAFSLIGDIAVAESFGGKDRATASAGAEGTTLAQGGMGDPYFTGQQFTNATGEVGAKAIANKYSDPIAGSLIMGFGTTAIDVTADLPPATALDTYDATLIASVVLTGGERGEGEADASGLAAAETTEVFVPLPASSEFNKTIESSGFSAGEVESSAAAREGLSLAAAAVGSSSTVHSIARTGSVAPCDSFIQDMNIMGSYAGGEGFGDRSRVSAESAYTAATGAESAVFTSLSGFDDPSVPLVGSLSGVAGSGGSSISARGDNLAKALSFAVAYQRAEDDVFNFGAPETALTTAGVAFGTQAEASDDARSTIASAEMEDTTLIAAAVANNGTTFQFPNSASAAVMSGGVSRLTLDPDRSSAKVDWTTYATFVSVGGNYTLSDEGKDSSTWNDPNYAYWYKYALASSEAQPVPPDLWVLPHFPPVTGP